MKALPFTAYVLIVALAFIGCTKNDDKSNVACVAAVLPDSLKFRITDKASGKDLFFSDPPTFSTEEIHVIQKNNAGKLDTLWLNVYSSATEGKYFSVIVDNIHSPDSCFIKIADTPTDTIVYSTVKDMNSSCPEYIFDDLKFNQSQTERKIHNKIINLKK